VKNNLKKYREGLGYSQIEFAKMLDVRQAYLSKLENNHIKEIPADIFISIRRIDIDADIPYIMGIDKEPQNKKSTELVKLNKKLISRVEELEDNLEVMKIAIRKIKHNE